MKLRSLLFGLAFVVINVSALTGRLRQNLNEDWRFYLGDPAGNPTAANYDDSTWEKVIVPHSHRIFSLDVHEFEAHGREHGWYRRRIVVPDEWNGKKVLIEFQGAMQTTKVWLNGSTVGEYAVSGFDSFHFDLTPYVKKGENVLAVLVDNRPNPKIPPDGVAMDFLLFGGLYRDVYLHITDPLHITFPWEDASAGVRITYPQLSKERGIIQIETSARNDSDRVQQCVLVTELLAKDGTLVGSGEITQTLEAGQVGVFVQKFEHTNPHLWSPNDPYLYTVRATLRAGQRVCDRLDTKTGMRWVRFDVKEGFFLNGEHLKLIGVNRHQSWPFIGFAVPNNLHRFDAQQIKEMGANWVRLSHYPQDPDFLDALDELGLMALAEAPTWNKIGGEHQWLANVCSSFRSMIRRDRNHPSVIVWNACINHHGAHPALVEIARREDPSRDRGQDTVRTPMDFNHRKVSGRGALSVEHTGHTLPAPRGGAHWTNDTGRVFHSELELAQRHWEHIDAVLETSDNAGAAAWAMYDYNTLYHTDEPGISWHGFADIFRLPKLSYYWHESEFAQIKSLHIFVQGERPVIFSNAAELKLWFDDGTGFKELDRPLRRPEETLSLRHPPIQLPDIAGVKRIKAEGVWLNGEVREEDWSRAGAIPRMDLTLDFKSLLPGEVTRIIANVSDVQDPNADARARGVDFRLRGDGELIGDNPAPVRAGKAVILFKAGSRASKAAISASISGLSSAPTSLETHNRAVNLN